MSVNLSLFAGAGWQFFDNNGVPLAGGLIYTYAAGTTTPQETYTSNTGGTAQANPIVLNSAGRVAVGEVWVSEGVSYKFVLKDSTGTTIGTYDNINASYAAADLANTTDPALGDALVGFRQSNASGNLTGATGRTVHQKLQESVSVLDFGAVGDGTTDCTTAIRNAIAAAKTATYSGYGSVFFPKGTYYITDTIVVDATMQLYGEISSQSDFATGSLVKVISGKSAFQIRHADNFTSYVGNVQFRNLGILAAGKLTTTTTANTTAASFTVTLAAASDFVTGQMILIRGAGESQTLGNPLYINATTTSGSATVTLSNDFGIYPGMRISVAGAGFTSAAYVVSRSGTSVTMSETAAASVVSQTITYYADMPVRILSGGGTTTLSVNQAPSRSLTGTTVEHYDCGIYANIATTVENCTIEYFSGAGIYQHGGASDIYSTLSNQSSNCNNFRVNNCILTNNRNGFTARGNDANAGNVIGANTYLNTEYAIMDHSFLGNYYFGCHASGGYGFMTLYLNALAVFSACYLEGGTYSTYGQRTLTIGGAGVDAAYGGVSLETSGFAAGLSTSTFYPGWSTTYQLTVGDTNTPFTLDTTALGGSTLYFQRTAATDGQAGLIGWSPGAAPRYAGLLTSDIDSDKGKGNAYAPQGLFIGNSGTITQTNFRQIIYGDAAPTTGTWVQGDIVFNRSPTASGYVGWVCTAGGTPGTWKTFGVISA